MKLSNAVASLVLFALLFGLILGSYNSFQSVNSYNITANETETNMLNDLNKLSIITNMNESFQSIYELKDGSGSATDILGALASAGIGVIKGVGGLLIFPFTIAGILGKNYNIPPLLIKSLLMILIIFIGFKIISAYLQQEV